MMNKDLTSEEKLLKLIRKKEVLSSKLETKPDAGKKAESKTGPKDNKVVFNFLSFLNRFLVVVILGIIVVIALRQFAVRKIEVVSSKAEVLEEEGAKLQQMSLPQTQPFSSYGNIISQRNIFQSPWEKPLVKDESKPQSDPLTELNKKLKLVGILFDANPTAIIEDQTTQQTLFMSPGDMVDNIKLEKIQPDKVIFLYNDQRVELTP